MISTSDFSIRLISWSSLRVILKYSSAALVVSSFCSAAVTLLLAEAEAEDSIICWLSLQVQAFNSAVEDLDPELARALWNWQSMIATEGVALADERTNS